MTTMADALRGYVEYLKGQGEDFSRPLTWEFVLNEVPTDRLAALQGELEQGGYYANSEKTGSGLKAKIVKAHSEQSLMEAVIYFERLATQNECSFTGFTFHLVPHAI